MFRTTLAAISLVAVLSLPSAAHEFWIDPQDPAPNAGDTLVADYRVGDLLAGSSLPWLDTMVAEALHHPPEGPPVPLSSLLGDRPALSVDLNTEGLHRITTVTHPAYVTFDFLAAFEEYLDYEGLDLKPDDHVARGLAPMAISEEYIRNARTLVSAGTLERGSADAPTGLDHELVVTGHPFEPGAERIEVTLLWQGRPVPDASVALIRALPGQEGTRRILRTDAKGKVTVPLGGPGGYLLNAVRIAPVDGPGAVRWQSHWASLFFELSR